MPRSGTRWRSGVSFPSTKPPARLTTRWFRRVIHGALETLDAGAESPRTPFPPAIRQRLGLIPRREAFWRAHWPDAGESFADLQAARTPAHVRLIFEELFFLELGLELKRRSMRGRPGIGFAIDDRVRQALKRILPFHPTAAQKRVLEGDCRRHAARRRPCGGCCRAMWARARPSWPSRRPSSPSKTATRWP